MLWSLNIVDGLYDFVRKKKSSTLYSGARGGQVSQLFCPRLSLRVEKIAYIMYKNAHNFKTKRDIGMNFSGKYV